MAPKRILFLWTHYSGYMAACWRALLARGIDVDVLCFKHSNEPTDPPFPEYLLKGINAVVLQPSSPSTYPTILDMLRSSKPDMVAIAGWKTPAFRNFINSKEAGSVPIAICMDNPYRGDLRQYLGSIRLKPLLKKISYLVVTGERSWQFGRFLGVPEEKIVRGLYGVDSEILTPALLARKRGNWPKRFLFIGRYDQRKGMDLLEDAYRVYRRQVNDPWELGLAGNGPLASNFLTLEGVENHGFVKPEDLPAILAKAGVFVLPSRYDAWPLSLVEAALSGLPIVCSNACGSSVEIVRHGYNGFIASTGSATSLANCLLKAHRLYDQLPDFGARSHALALPWSSDEWARRWNELLLANS